MSVNSAEIVGTTEFRDFLIEAKQHGYGTPDANVVTARGGAKELWYGDADPFLYVDHFVGGNPYGGHEIVSYSLDGTQSPLSAKPIWNMSYYETEFDPKYITGDQIRAILGKILPKPDIGLPVRGSSSTTFDFSGTGLVQYEFKPEKGSSLSRFRAEETVRLNGQRVYAARFIGGLISSH